jgi:ADP-ribosylglycohydrolase
MDNILGCVFGGAYSDALGKATEFMSKEKAKNVYGNRVTFESIVQDFHRDAWDKYDWTDDTDQTVLVMRTVASTTHDSSHLDFAKRLNHWVFNGFPELGDKSGCGIGAPVGWVINFKEFRSDPYFASHEVWKSSDGYMYEDGAIMRTAPIGCFKIDKMMAVLYTISICKVTHFDPRCVGACVFIVSCVYEFVNNNRKDVDNIIAESQDLAISEMTKLDYVSDVSYTISDYVRKIKNYINKGMSNSLDNIDFDKGSSRSNTKNPLICAVYAMKNMSRKSFDEIIQYIIMQGGDADTNACVAGSVMGAYLGYSQLPRDVNSLKHHDWLMKECKVF